MRRPFASCRTSSASGPIAPRERPGRGGGGANFQWRSMATHPWTFPALGCRTDVVA